MTRYFRCFGRIISTIFACCMLLLTLNTAAEQVLQKNGFSIHYNAFNSAMLTPEIATLYGINRSSSLGVINISVLNKSKKPVTAFVDGNAKNPLFQFTKLIFSKATEGDAIYYVATFSFADKERLTFDIIVAPEGEKQITKLNFSKQFFVE